MSKPQFFMHCHRWLDKKYSLLLVFTLVLFCSVSAQQIIAPPATNDTTRVIQIVQGKSLRQITVNDTTVLETIAGNVILKEGLTTFYCDSATINQQTNILEAYGNVHINQNDSIHTYAKYLKYIGKERTAYLRGNVKMTDKKGILLTDEFEYNLGTGIGKYSRGGKVINGKTVLTSDNGVYYSETKDVYFKDNVHLVDPKYDIKNDSLLYNTQSQVATFISETYIKSKNGGDIYTKEGFYDLKNGKAFFGKRTIIKDSTRTYVADNSAYDEASGIAQLEGNAVIKDSVNGYTIMGNQIFSNKKTNTFLATRKPVLIFKGEGNDSTYISADTLFSGLEKITPALSKDTAHVDSMAIDTLKNIKLIKPSRSDKTIPALNNDTITVVKDSLIIDTLKTTKVITASSSDTAIRYFQAFHHVRIFNDSLQSVCDSLYYSSLDSTFRLFNDPVVFSNHSQITGDTIYLYTKNKKVEKVYVFYSGMIVNKPDENIYNQIGGRTLTGYFKHGELDYVRTKGSPAESIFYPQDKDSAYVGMNRSKGDVIDIYFVNKEVNKVKFINDVDGTMFPLRRIPADQKYLKGFKWQDARRPKNKFEIFE